MLFGSQACEACLLEVKGKHDAGTVEPKDMNMLLTYRFLLSEPSKELVDVISTVSSQTAVAKRRAAAKDESRPAAGRKRQRRNDKATEDALAFFKK